MSEDVPVNTGTVEWPSVDSAYFAVRRMQTKLHRWAGDDVSRRFGDLFNLVYDPAFLMHAWGRVSTNTGARTAGIDKTTTAMIEPGLGRGVPGPDPGLVEVGRVHPGEVRQVMIPKGDTGKFGNWGFPPSLIGWSRPA